jgi:hypothetical protein
MTQNKFIFEVKEKQLPDDVPPFSAEMVQTILAESCPDFEFVRLSQPDVAEMMVDRLNDMLKAIDAGIIDSEPISDNYGAWPFHKEWGKYARDALAAYEASKQPQTSETENE